MRRVVLDPVVMLRGLLNPHSPCGQLLRRSDRYRAIFSNATVTVLRALLLHPLLVDVVRELGRISTRRLDSLLLSAECVQLPAAPAASVFADIGIFAATARAAQADYLVGEDPDILANCARHAIPTLDARAFLALLDSELTAQPVIPAQAGIQSGEPDCPTD